MFQRRRFIQSVGGIISAGFCNAGLNRVFQAVKAHNRQGISPSLSAYDEDFFFYFEETEWNFRIIKNQVKPSKTPQNQINT